MNREKFAWSVSVVLLAILAFQIPGTLAGRDDDYAFVRTLVDIHRQVTANYVDPVDEDKLREGTIDGMLNELDPFSNYIPPVHEEEFDRMLDGSFKGVGIQLNQLEDGRVEVVTPVDGSPAVKAGVQPGDIIEKVNGDSLDGLRLPDVIKKIGGPLGTEVRMTVKHPSGEEVELKMTRQEVHVPSVKGYSRNADNTWNYFLSDDSKIAYVRLSQFVPDSFEEMKAALTPLVSRGMQGLILDLRFNPGGRLDQARDIVNLFIDHGVIVSTKGRNRAEEIYQAKPEGVLRGTNDAPAAKFPMIVLVNEHSASASEIVSGSLMDNKRALVIGSRTYGKGSVQEVIPLDEKGGELKLTVAYYYLPSGKCVHRKKDSTDWGVDPQIVVPMDAAGEAKVMQDRYDHDIFHRSATAATTNASTTMATTKNVATTAPAEAPATQPAYDAQLQRAVDTMTALMVLNGKDIAMAPTPVPPIAMTVTPATQTTTNP